MIVWVVCSLYVCSSGGHRHFAETYTVVDAYWSDRQMDMAMSRWSEEPESWSGGVAQPTPRSRLSVGIGPGIKSRVPIGHLP